VRAAVAVAKTANDRVTVFATTPRNHTQILSKEPGAVTGAIEDVVQRAARD
jgi:hypothetical protein